MAETALALPWGLCRHSVAAKEPFFRSIRGVLQEDDIALCTKFAAAVLPPLREAVDAAAGAAGVVAAGVCCMDGSGFVAERGASLTARSGAVTAAALDTAGVVGGG